MLVDLHALTKESQTCKCWVLKDSRPLLGGGGGGQQVGPDLRRWEQLVDTYKSYPNQIPSTFEDGFVLIHTRIWWAGNLHGHSP